MYDSKGAAIHHKIPIACFALDDIKQKNVLALKSSIAASPNLLAMESFTDQESFSVAVKSVAEEFIVTGASELLAENASMGRKNSRVETNLIGRKLLMDKIEKNVTWESGCVV